jgi:hypothetical protein
MYTSGNTLHKVMRIMTILILFSILSSLSLFWPPTSCNHIDNFIFRFSIIFKIFRIIFFIYINIIYKCIFIFQQTFQNIIALTYVQLLTKYNVSSEEVLFHLIYYNTFEYVAPCYVALHKLSKRSLLKLIDSTLFSSTVNVLCDAGCYTTPKHSGTT